MQINRSVVDEEDLFNSEGSNSQSFDEDFDQEDEDIGSDSGLSELSNEEAYFQTKQSHQRKALF